MVENSNSWQLNLMVFINSHGLQEEITLEMCLVDLFYKHTSLFLTLCCGQIEMKYSTLESSESREIRKK